MTRLNEKDGALGTVIGFLAGTEGLDVEAVTDVLEGVFTAARGIVGETPALRAAYAFLRNYFSEFGVAYKVSEKPFSEALNVARFFPVATVMRRPGYSLDELREASVDVFRHLPKMTFSQHRALFLDHGHFENHGRLVLDAINILEKAETFEEALELARPDTRPVLGAMFGAHFGASGIKDGEQIFSDRSVTRGYKDTLSTTRLATLVDNAFPVC